MSFNLNDLGQVSLFLSWFVSLFVFISGLALAIKKKDEKVLYLKNFTIFNAFISFISLVILGALFLKSEFINQYVWQTSNLSMPWIYKITAIWGGMDGSMLLWASLLVIGSGIVAWGQKNYPQEIRTWLLTILNSSCLFFLSVTLFLTNPFRYIKVDFIPPDGNGLNPLLQNPYMAIHPPMLYLGFTLFSIPYAFALSSLFAGEFSNQARAWARKTSLIAWSFLTAGITLGGFWAYIELGWGGFWAWDPVENSSFLPWLTATAFIHSIIVEEKKGILKIWNFGLIISTYALTVFGTFLTRSGIVQSVHAFASTNVGEVFLIYLILIICVSTAIIIYRLKKLKPETKLESFFSKEVFILVGNILFVSICFATFWGVMFPVFSEALTGTKQAVGIPFFNTVNVPLFLVLFFTMSFAPFIAWKKGSGNQFRKTFFVPILLTSIFSSLLIFLGIEGFYPLLSYSIACFLVLTICFEQHKSIVNNKKSANINYFKASINQVSKKPRRTLGLFVHIGLAIAVIGITASMATKIEKEFTLAVGEQFKVGRYILELNDLIEVEEKNYAAVRANISVYFKDLEFYTTMIPEFRQYYRNQETTTEVALKPNLKEDLYIVIAGIESFGEKASFKVYINPLQIFLWIGVIIMVLGTAIISFRKVDGN